MVTIVNACVMPKVSVIIPVYNAEKYLCRCLDSICAQSFTDWECILVDDGSMDNSSSICDDYVSRENRFRVIHKENGGVSTARNTGIAQAQSEYIVFIDADDYVNPCYLLHLVTATTEQVDFVVAGICRSISGGVQTVSRPTKSMLEGVKIREYFINSVYDNMRGGPCCKLFRKSIIQENKLLFPLNIHYLEDDIFVLNYMLHCHRMVTIDEADYYYNLHENSLVSTVNTFISESDCYNAFTALHTKYKKKFFLQGKENLWFVDKRLFIISRQVISAKLAGNAQLLNQIDWTFYKKSGVQHTWKEKIRVGFLCNRITRALMYKMHLL